MIKIKQLGSKVKVTLNPEIDGKVIVLNWETTDEWYALLLCDKLNKVLREKVESARRTRLCSRQGQESETNMV